eukprot:2894287-Rhodomonas_salina.2
MIASFFEEIDIKICTDTRRDDDQKQLTNKEFGQMMADGWPSEQGEDCGEDVSDGLHSISTPPENLFIADLEDIHLLGGYIQLNTFVPHLASLTVKPGEDL